MTLVEGRGGMAWISWQVSLWDQSRYRGLRKGLSVSTWPHKLSEETGPHLCLPRTVSMESDYSEWNQLSGKLGTQL